MERNNPPLNAAVCGKLNPEWVEWLMNWPIGWTKLEALNYEHFNFWKKASTTGFQTRCGLRKMWFDTDFAYTQYRPRCNEQCQGKLADHMQRVSRKTTSNGTVAESQQEETVHILSEVVCVQEGKGNYMLFELCKQDGMAQQVTRVTAGVKNRVDRLKAIGNGQVPSVVRLAWETLTAKMED
jgi:hypothetical protein